VLICHCSYRGVVELVRDLFDIPISVGTIHNRLQSAATSALEINQAQDLSRIKVGLHDEIFQGSQPVLAGVDAASTYCYLLQGAEHRDEETWGWQNLAPNGSGSKSGPLMISSRFWPLSSMLVSILAVEPILNGSVNIYYEILNKRKIAFLIENNNAEKPIFTQIILNYFSHSQLKRLS